MPLRHLGLLFSSYMDWGASLGFDWAARHPNWVKSICYMETMVRPRKWSDLPEAY
jgi:haloalkane dehalogenase